MNEKFIQSEDEEPRVVSNDGIAERFDDDFGPKAFGIAEGYGDGRSKGPITWSGMHGHQRCFIILQSIKIALGVPLDQLGLYGRKDSVERRRKTGFFGVSGRNTEFPEALV